MEIDLTQLLETKNAGPAAKLTGDPVAWVQQTLADDDEFAYRPVPGDEHRWKATSLHRSHLITVDVSVDGGSVLVKASIDIVPPDEASAHNIRVLQMHENPSFRNRGYLPAKASEPVTFAARHAIDDSLDLIALVSRFVSTLKHQCRHLESACQNERPASEICWELKKEGVEAYAASRKLSI